MNQAIGILVRLWLVIVLVFAELITAFYINSHLNSHTGVLTTIQDDWHSSIAHAQTDTPTPTLPPGEQSSPSPATESATLPIPEEILELQIDHWMSKMAVADKVGQLFLITFMGNNTGFDSDIAELIYGYRVGGVVLNTENGNFSNGHDVNTSQQVATLANQLQALSYGLLLPAELALIPLDFEQWPPRGTISMEQLTSVPPANLPLFVAVEQEGDSLPYTSLRRGFTPLPSQLALGATWNPELTQQVGQIVGRELHSVGINMVLGPNLDVLEQPRPNQVGTLGIHTFGGDPYWVGQMGRAYIAGVHQGSAGQVATIARHFPGAGDTDRLPDMEVATVQRSREDLQKMTLPPFHAVTRQASTVLNPIGDPAATDGMQSSHTRYSGIQGNNLGRNTPISLAPELQSVLEQEGFSQWRAQGGIMVSNALGVPAIRRYYSPDLIEFPYRRVALDAFTAGHDLLYLDRFGLDDRWETEKENIKETIIFFQERYVSDSDFAAQVDAAVRRILHLKLRLYAPPPALAQPPETDSSQTVTNTSTLSEDMPIVTTTVPNTQSNDGMVDTIGAITDTLPITMTVPSIALADVLKQEADLQALTEEIQDSALTTVGQVAREAFTILYPDPEASSDLIYIAPEPDDQLLIFTESRLLHECEGCIAEAAIGPDEIASIIMRLYGPDGTGLLQSDQIVSMTYADLAELLDTEAAENEAAQIETQADPQVETQNETQVETQNEAQVENQDETEQSTESAPTPDVDLPATVISGTNAVETDPALAPVSLSTPQATPAQSEGESPTLQPEASGEGLDAGAEEGSEGVGEEVGEEGSEIGSGEEGSSEEGSSEEGSSEEGSSEESLVPEQEGETQVLDKNARMSVLIEEADWLIFAMLDVAPDMYEHSDVLKQFLRQRGDQLSNKRIFVLAHHAPYFLDATEISKLNGYYGVYSKTQPFLESAVRALFRAFTPAGAPPVNVPGTRFGNLQERLMPDPTLPVELVAFSATGEPITGAEGAEGLPPAVVDAGSVIRLQAGPVSDYNGKPIHDSTYIDFVLTYEGDESNQRVESASTRNGVAVRDVLLDRGGEVEISAQVGEATTSQPIALNVQGSLATAAPVQESPTQEVVPTPAPVVPTAEPLAAVVQPAPPPVEAEPAPVKDEFLDRRITLVSLILAVITIIATLSLLLIVQVRVLPRQTLVHSMLWAVNCGLLAYIFYGLGLVPGASWLQSSLKVWAGALVVFIAMLFPLLWLQLRADG